LHLYKSHKEGAIVAYIPELAMQDNPFNSLIESDVDRAPAPEKRLWQTSQMFIPAATSQTMEEPDDALDTKLFSNVPIITFSAISLVTSDGFQNSSVRLWTDETEQEAIMLMNERAAAQQRRKEQREAAWARKKLERTTLSEAAFQPIQQQPPHAYVCQSTVGILIFH
jgi:hypothetical protein